MLSIGNHTFSSKKQLEQYVRSMLFRFRLNPIDVFEITGDDFDFFLELFKRHPSYNSKIGSGVKQIFVGPSVYFGRLKPDASFLLIKRVDGTQVDISWRLCVSGKSKTDSAYQLEALRKSIQSQIYQFSQESIEAPCNICDSKCGPFEIDHYDKDFKDLVKEFTRSTELPTEFDQLQEGGHIFRKQDQEIELKWIIFHKQHAKLQKICKVCHKNKTFKSYKKASYKALL